VSESWRVATIRAVLAAALTFGIEEPPIWRRSADFRPVAELVVADPPADLFVLDVARPR
jgi:hypothetical protein